MKLEDSLLYGNPFDPMCVEYNIRKGHFSMTTSHIHSHYELYYLFSGQRVYFIKDRSYTINAGDIVIIPGDVVHRTLDSGIPDHERVVLYLNESYFQQFNEEDEALLRTPFLSDRPVIGLSRHVRRIIEQQLYTMLHEIQEQPSGYKLTIQHTITNILLLVARSILASDGATSETELTPTQAKMMEIAKYINANFREDLTLERLSHHFYLSESYLSRTFKKLTGFSFTEYVGMTRVKEAQRLLRESHMRITDISEEVGFGSFAHFQKVFKELTTLSPRDYRSQFKE